MKTDIEIAQAATPCPITEIAEKAGISEEYLECYGKTKAKVDYNLLRNEDHKPGKLVLVTAINPTAAGLTVDRLHTLRKGVRVILVAAFDLTFSLRPLPLCLEVTKELANDLVSPPQQRLSGKRRMSNRSEERRQHTAAEIRFDRSSLREKRAKGWIASFRPSLIAPYKRCDIAAAAPRSSCDNPAPRTDIWTDRRPACRP